MNTKSFRAVNRALPLCVAGIALLCLAVPAMGSEMAEEALPWEDARRFAEALQTIREQYAEPVDDTLLITEAIRGMAAGLDPYSVYLDADEYEQARISAFGRYEGIGVEVSRTADAYVIVTPFDGGPAQRAGLLPGDRLLRANGKPLAGLDPVQLDTVLHGATGTQVVLQVQRGDDDPFDVTLTRELVNIPSVSGEVLAGNTGYVRIALISDGSSADLERLLNTLGAHDGKLSGVILDLRNNAGGVVDGAVEIADAFLDDGVIVSTRGRAAGQSFDYTATPKDLLADLPMVVLVNGGTASAAEIVAGALQDHSRATVLGSTTFGKGAVQSMIPLEGGGALMITTAHYRTPSGRLIEGAGIVPDVETSEADAALGADTASDTLTGRAVELLDEARRNRNARR